MPISSARIERSSPGPDSPHRVSAAARRGVLPVGTRRIAVIAANQDGSLSAITPARPITKRIAANAAIEIDRVQVLQPAGPRGDGGVRQGFGGTPGRPVAIRSARAATAKAESERMHAEADYRVAHAKLMGAIGDP